MYSASRDPAPCWTNYSVFVDYCDQKDVLKSNRILCSMSFCKLKIINQGQSFLNCNLRKAGGMKNIQEMRWGGEGFTAV